MHHRRRKKRSNLGHRTVVIGRGINGFGFTISGQQPCILSCIVEHSPADLAGLKPGNFLISVNGMSVSRLPHDTVAQLIGNAIGTIRISIAENYFSDSSDEDVNLNKTRQKYVHHKHQSQQTTALHSRHVGNSSTSSMVMIIPSDHRTDRHQKEDCAVDLDEQENGCCSMPSLASEEDNQMKVENFTAPNATVVTVNYLNKIVNINMNAKGTFYDNFNNHEPQCHGESNEMLCKSSLEYRVMVGYMGTIEMPDLVATDSKLQTVNSCIRKMRQEKRKPVIVLMTILPNYLTLTNATNTLLAKYPSTRLTYVNGSSEIESRFFGLVTTATYSDGQLVANGANLKNSENAEYIVCNSCHVFSVDPKITDHLLHKERTDKFKFICTRDPISNLCLEFPASTEYIVNLIRSMYSIKRSKSPERPARNSNTNRSKSNYPQYRQQLPSGVSRANYNMWMMMMGANANRMANERTDDMNGNQHLNELVHSNSPQPSNHSEVTTTSSNSDSGIGFHNDCLNISDRILIVDFPDRHQQPTFIPNSNQNDEVDRFEQCVNEQSPAKSIDYGTTIETTSIDDDAGSDVDYHLTVRNVNQSKRNLLPYQLLNNLKTARSCDDIITSYRQEEFPISVQQQQKGSIDDLNTIRKSTNSATSNGNFNFIDFKIPVPRNLFRKYTHTTEPTANLTTNKFTSKLFTKPKPLSKQTGKYCTKQKEVCNEGSIGGSGASYAGDITMEGKSILIVSSGAAVADNEYCELVMNENIPLKYNSNETEMDNLFKKTNNDICGGGGRHDHCLNKSNAYSMGVSGIVSAHSEPNIWLRGLTQPNSSPSKRWCSNNSSFRSCSNQKGSKMVEHLRSSLTVSDTDVYSKSLENMSSSRSIFDTSTNKSNRNSDRTVVSWRTSFEKLLIDPAGMHTFSEFLKIEFSAENIYFWAACERFRFMDQTNRAAEASRIYNKHLAIGASDPVNIDSHARNTTQENLQFADIDLFVQAQKQVFNLMKFDSYQRFIRSDLYKKCLDAENRNEVLPYPAETLDKNLYTDVHTRGNKLRKSLSNADDRRRKSLLPWHRKNRGKSGERNDDGKCTISGKTIDDGSVQSNYDIHSSRSSLSSFDAALSCRSGQQTSNTDDYKSSSLCRVILSNGATTIVQTNPNEIIRTFIEKLLEKRGIFYHSFECFYANSNKAINLDEMSSMLAGKEIYCEQRVVFKLDLPNRKIISVKSKPTKILKDVLRPILNKYNYRLENVDVYTRDNTDLLEMDVAITESDGLRLQIICKPQTVTEEIVLNRNVDERKQLANAVVPTPTNPSPSTMHHVSGLPIPPNIHYSNAYINHKPNSQGMNLTCNGLPQYFQSDAISNYTTSIISDTVQRQPNDSLADWKSEIFNSPASLNNTCISDTVPNGPEFHMKMPLIAKLKSGAKLQMTTKLEKQDLLEGLKRAQRSRLEDQRGTKINFELPDFLKDKENNDLSPSQYAKYQQLQSLQVSQNWEAYVRSNRNLSIPYLDVPSEMSNSLNTSNRYNNLITDNEKNENLEILQHTNNCTNDQISEKTFNNPNYYNYSSSSYSHDISSNDKDNKEPPPLPPKPKHIPIKPSNWSKSANTDGTTISDLRNDKR